MRARQFKFQKNCDDDRFPPGDSRGTRLICFRARSSFVDEIIFLAGARGGGEGAGGGGTIDVGGKSAASFHVDQIKLGL